MKPRKRPSLLLTATAVLSSLLWPSLVRAVPYTLHADVDMHHIYWNAGPGVNLVWLSDWELLTSASSFDSVNGFAGDFQSAMGQPASVSASANSGYSSATAQASVDNAGNPLGLQASLDVTFAPGVTFASAFSTAMGYREFMITGGSGAVNVTFGFDYLAHLIGDAPSWGADFRALLSISDGTTTYDLQAYSLLATPMNATILDSLSHTLVLQYGTPYSFALSVDPDSTATPDTGPGLLVTGLVFASLMFLPSFRRKA